MRLIDADMFEKELEEELLPALIEKYGEEEANNGLHFSFRDIMSNLAFQPEIMTTHLIDADALKKKLIQQRDKIEKEKKYGWEFTANGLNIAISITGIEAALYGVGSTGWIPCTERLPETERHAFYLISSKGTSWIAKWNGEYWASIFFPFVEMEEVDAWQPMPEPWKGEE